MSSYSQSSYLSSNSNYSQSSFSPPMSSPYTPSSQTSDSFGNDNVFKFPPVVKDKYIVSTTNFFSIKLIPIHYLLHGIG